MRGDHEVDLQLAEANRQFTICNACRYCREYCAVFPAMELRTEFLSGDLSYLANLCHDCQACYQACMYTEPHQFAINLPAMLAESRTESYARYSYPRWLKRVFDAGPTAIGMLTAGVIGIMLVLFAVFGALGDLFVTRTGDGAFYEVVSHTAMAAPALLLSGFALSVAGIGLVAFWRDMGERRSDLLDLPNWATTFREIGELRWMRGGGNDCFYPEPEQSTPARRRMHQLVMYGFLLAFIATVAAFIKQGVFQQLPPYPMISEPVILGTVGGVMMIWGCIGLLALKLRSVPELTTQKAKTMDLAFLTTLLLVSVTGVALLILRETSLMGAMLLLHLATVVVLYLLAPYGKFIHAVYRFGAVLRSVQERRALGQ